MESNLTDLANRLGTDKGSLVGNSHCYTATYQPLFGDQPDRPLRILEIGLSIGGPETGADPARTVISVPSVELWLEYFPNATVTGLDISDCSAFVRPRFDFIQADCGDAQALQRVARDRQFDVIIDDGSHASFHQQLTLRELLPALAPGGLYIIEDLDWQPAEYERNLPPVPKTAELLAWMANPRRMEIGAGFGWEQWANARTQISEIELLRKSELESAVPAHQRRPRSGFFKRRREHRRARYLGELSDPVKLAIIRKA